MSKRDPYNRIVRAWQMGCGVRLSADEVQGLSVDGAIEQRASDLLESPELWSEQLKMAGVSNQSENADG